MTTTESLLEILKSRGIVKEMSEEERIKEEFIHFSDDPMMILMGYTALHSTNEYYNYSGVFDDEKDLSLPYNREIAEAKFENEDFNDLRAKARKVIEHYRMYITTAKLLDLELSKWSKSLAESLKQMDNMRLQIKYLPLVVKLPRFFELANRTGEYYNNCSRPNELVDEENAVRKLTYVDSYKHPANRRKDSRIFWFEDHDKALYQMSMANDVIAYSAMMKLFATGPVTVKSELMVEWDLDHHRQYYYCIKPEFI